MKTHRKNPFLHAAGFTLISLSAASAQWNNAGPDSDWNNPDNWTPVGVPTGINAVVNTNSGNIATISSDVAAIPVDIIAGSGVGNTGRIDQLAGTVATGAGNWLIVGQNGGSGTYNLANPASTGGQYTGMGPSSGNINVGGSLYVGGNAQNTTGTFNMNTSGNVNIPGVLQVGQQAGSVGVLNIDSGTMTTGGWTEIGNFGGNGTLRMSGGALTKGGNDHFIIAANGATGLSIISGGALTVNNEIWVGNGGGSNGTLELSGGSVKGSSWVAIGRENGTGNVNMSGGTWVKDGGGNFIVGASGPGTMNQSGGLVDVQTGITWIGEANNATAAYTLSGTGEFRTTQIVAARDAGTTANINLNGGTLQIGSLNGGGGTANVSFNGTQINASAANNDFITDLDTAAIAGGGLLINADVHDIKTAQVLTGSGGLVKSGSGPLTLNGANTYAGATEITEGSLIIGATGSVASSSSLVLGASTTLDVTAAVGFTVGSGKSVVGTGTIAGDIAFASGATLSPGNSPGTLTFNDDLSLAAGSFTVMEIANLAEMDRLLIAGDFSANGTIQINLIDGYSPAWGATFDLVDVSGATTGTPTLDLSGAALAPGYTWKTDSFMTNGSISVVPEPSAALLGAFGALALIRRRRTA